MFINPIRQSSFNFPLNLAPAKIGRRWAKPVFRLHVIPILREKNGRVDGKLHCPKRSLLSRKNCLLSGKNSSKRLRLVCCLSTSTCEKSGLMVKSKFKEGVMPIFASKPASKELSEENCNGFKVFSSRGKILGCGGCNKWN